MPAATQKSQFGAGAGAKPAARVDYERLFEFAPVGYVSLSDAGSIQCINRVGAHLLGGEARSLEGQPLIRWIARTDRALFEAHLARARCSTCSVVQELRFKNRQGRLLNVRLESARDPHAIGTVRSTFTDVSGERALARDARRLHAQLVHLTRLNTCGELVAGLAHELNQPLGSVVLNCEAASRLIAQSAEHALVTEALSQAVDAAKFASSVVRHLRDFLRFHGEMRSVGELAPVVKAVVMLIEADARDREIELEVEVADGLPELWLNPVRIEQVLLNLVHNSIESIGDGGGLERRVCIRAFARSKHEIQVSVLDTGRGMDRSQLDRLFTAFYTTKPDGMGMGLAISRSIVEMHGGQLWAESSGPSTGAMFHFTLPTTERGSSSA